MDFKNMDFKNIVFRTIANGGHTEQVTEQGTEQGRFSVALKGFELVSTVINEAILERYVEKFKEELKKPSRTIGTWFNKEDALYYIDTVHLIDNEEEAIEEGMKNGQIAIFDLQELREIKLK